MASPNIIDQTRPDRNSWLKSIKKFVKAHNNLAVIARFYRYVRRCYWSSIHWYYRKDRVRYNLFGHTLSKIPYIVRDSNTGGAGLFSCFFAMLSGIAYAAQNGYIPVVDMKHYPNAYLFPDEVGKINAWEYYFEQPEGVSLEDALSCKKYIMGRDTGIHKAKLCHLDADTFFNRNGDIDFWRALCKKYIRFTPEVIARVERMTSRTAGRKILGVLARGTDYTAVKLSKHHIPPTAEQIIAKTREAMETEHFDAVYLATEDKNILLKFQEAFGEKLLLPDKANYFDDYDYDNAKLLISYMNSDKYTLGLDYLVSILFLSRCSGFIVSITTGSLAAMCFSEEFDYLYVFDLGVYP